MSDQQPAVIVKDLYKSFKLPHEQHSGIKQVILNFAKRKKGYEVQHVLNDVSFEIKKGEFFGIVGRNGSGKSTLLKLLAGIYVPDKGLVQVNGSLTPFIELGVGFNPELTGRENVFMNGALLGFGRPEMEEMYDDIVSFAELERFMDQKLKNYSSGMQVRLAFSIAIRARSAVLLIDEVLAVGDSAFQQKCFDYFERLKKEQRTIIFVTHDMSAVKRFCDRAVLIEKGNVKQIGRPASIADQYLLDNIDPTAKNKNIQKTSTFTEDVAKLQLKRISEKSLSSQDSLEFELNYKLTHEFPPVLAYTIARDGVSITEMNSMELILSDTTEVVHSVKHSLPLQNFNPGLYKIDVALFDRTNMNIKAYKLKTVEFIVKGNDPSRGGALRSNGEWSIINDH